jgi:LysR family glycine cleavage system transcriptional activator
MSLPRTLMPSLNELAAFEAAGRHESFTRAAEELALTQSAISKQVRQLEETLGVVLFNRVKGRVVLTTLGCQYIRFARNVLLECEAATHAVIASGGSQATLRIAVLPTFASRWMIPRLPSFLVNHPSLTVSLRSETEPFDFESTPVDVAIHYGGPSWAGANATYLFDEVLVAVTSPDYAASLDLTEPADLLRAALLQQATRPSLWGQWFQAAAIDHPYPYRGMTFDQFSMASQAAATGLGVALMPAFLIERELEEGRLVQIGQPLALSEAAYYAVAPLEKEHDPLVLSFIRWLVESAGRPVEA